MDQGLYTLSADFTNRPADHSLFKYFFGRAPDKKAIDS